MALSDLPATGASNFNSLVRTVLNEWKAGIEAKAAASHDHGSDPAYFSIVANEAALGTGAQDGQLVVCTDSGNVYSWDNGNSKWRILPGNTYSTDPSASTYTIETGTRIYNSTDQAVKEYDGSVWTDTRAIPNKIEGFILSQSVTINGLDAAYQWIDRGSYDHSFHASGGGNPNIGKPAGVVVDNGSTHYAAYPGASDTGDLAGGTWRWQDMDSIGYDALYMHVWNNTVPGSCTAITIYRADPISISAGSGPSDDGTAKISLAIALAKHLRTAWSEGDGGGMLDTGSIAANQRYCVYAIYNPTTDTTDILASTSMTSPTLPSGYTKKMVIGFLYTDEDGYPVPFEMTENGFIRFTNQYQMQIGGNKGVFSSVHQVFDISSHVPTGHYAHVELGGICASTSSPCMSIHSGKGSNHIAVYGVSSGSWNTTAQWQFNIYGVQPRIYPTDDDKIYARDWDGTNFIQRVLMYGIQMKYR